MDDPTRLPFRPCRDGMFLPGVRARHRRRDGSHVPGSAGRSGNWPWVADLAEKCGLRPHLGDPRTVRSAKEVRTRGRRASRTSGGDCRNPTARRVRTGGQGSGQAHGEALEQVGHIRYLRAPSSVRMSGPLLQRPTRRIFRGPGPAERLWRPFRGKPPTLAPSRGPVVARRERARRGGQECRSREHDRLCAASAGRRLSNI
jgi:hypothetical protein